VPAASTGRLVALALPPGDAFAGLAERAWERGDAVCPLDPAAAPEVTAALVEAMRPHALVDGAGEHPLDGAVETEPGTAVVIATSGSTGPPKGAALSWTALDASGDATLERIGARPDEAWLSCLPWHHIGGLQVLLRARLLGSEIDLRPSIDAASVATTDATLVSLVPTQLTRLLDAGVDLSRFRVILLGGAAASPRLLERAREAGAPVVTTYGMSETCGGCVYDGVPLTGVDVRLDDDAVISISGDVLMTGYRLQPELTSTAVVDGWFRTSDLGWYDAEGRLAVHGRVDDMIVTGGEKVSAAAVEHALAEHPDVRAVAVVGVPDDEWGQRVVAVVVAAPAPTLAELRSWVADRVGRAAAPRDVALVERIPLLSSGKPDRQAVARLAQAERGAGARRSQSAEPPSTT
jgi:o-succinylbenzoate---CoA ligase